MFVAQREVKNKAVTSATKIVSFITLNLKTTERPKEIDVANNGSRIIYHITGSVDPLKSELISDKSVIPFSKLIESDSTKVVGDKIFDETTKKLLSKILDKVTFKECDSHDTLSDEKCRCTVMGLEHIYPTLLGDAFESSDIASQQVRSHLHYIGRNQFDNLSGTVGI